MRVERKLSVPYEKQIGLGAFERMARSVLERWKNLCAEDLDELGLITSDIVNIDLGKSRRSIGFKPLDMVDILMKMRLRVCANRSNGWFKLCHILSVTHQLASGCWQIPLPSGMGAPRESLLVWEELRSPCCSAPL